MTDPRATLERLLAPEVLQALDRYIADAIDAHAVRADGKAWLTTAEAAQALGCTPRAVRMRHKRGRLEGRYHGRRLYIASRSVVDLGRPAADAHRILSNTVTPATLQRPGVRPRRKGISA